MPFVLSVLLTASFNPQLLTVDLTTVPIVDQKEIWQEALAQCESQGSTTIKVWDTNNRWSIGKYQYQYATWAKYSWMGTTRENITDGELQDRVTRYVLDTKGWGDWYNCGKFVQSQVGSYPRN